MTANQNKCPFHIGDVVIYRPSAKGLASEAMTSPKWKLIPGKKYIISDIRNDRYIVVEGIHHPGGGLYWTEFEFCK